MGGQVHVITQSAKDSSEDGFFHSPSQVEGAPAFRTRPLDSRLPYSDLTFVQAKFESLGYPACVHELLTKMPIWNLVLVVSLQR